MFVKRIALFSALAIALTAAPVSATDIAPQYFMNTERSVYDPNIDSIEVTIRNASDKEAGYDLYFTLNSLKGTVAPSQPVSVPDLAGILPPGGEAREVIRLDAYDRPFEPGYYYITKSVEGEKLSAGFMIRGENCLDVEKPESMDITIQKDGRRGAYTVKSYGTPGDLSKLWHQLLIFQKGTKPVLSGDPIATIRLNGAQTVALDFYRAGKKLWTEKAGKWYYSEFPGITENLTAYAIQSGAFLPATGEELIKELNALPPLKNVRFTAHDFTRPFQLSGWQSDRKASGVTLSVFQFPNADAVNRQMRYLYDDGYTLGIESAEGNGASQSASFSRKRFDWSQPPHYFKAGSRLVLYNGGDQAILSALVSLLGPEVISH